MSPELDPFAIRPELLSCSDGVYVHHSESAFRTVLNGHLNAAGMLPTGWFGGYAVRDKD
jgi:hypothetical protein